jgi:MFS superfamily sulfate permease-like transporter
LKNLRKIPSALIVLLVSIALVNFLGIKNDPVHKYMPLLDFKDGFFDIIGINESFNGIFHFGTFLKYLVLFTLIGSLESLLTVRAVDRMDPYNRTSNVNKDLIALGLGNIVAGILGGLPMIAEVARSSSNVANGAKTRWSNFFHGIFILLFLIFATSFSDLIPKSALAAMLIGVGWKLAHPKEFVHIAKIGLDQIIVFATTILVTLFIDLLIGIAAGILIKLVLHVARGVSISALFNPRLKVHKQRITVRGALVFSNFMKVKTKIGLFPSDSKVVLDVRQCRLVDHSVVESLEHLRREFAANGGELKVYGIDEFRPVKKSSHPLSARIKMNK